MRFPLAQLTLRHKGFARLLGSEAAPAWRSLETQHPARFPPRPLSLLSLSLLTSLSLPALPLSVSAGPLTPSFSLPLRPRPQVKPAVPPPPSPTMHLPTLLALPVSFLLSTALARPVLDPSALDVEGSWRLPPSFLFPPPPLNSTHSQEKSKRNVVKNPKVVLNPKNPAFESSARSLAAVRTSTAVWVPAPTTVETTRVASSTTREALQTTTTTMATGKTTSTSSGSTSSKAASTTSSAPAAQFTGQAVRPPSSHSFDAHPSGRTDRNLGCKLVDLLLPFVPRSPPFPSSYSHSRFSKS
ncbi:hypothetical protein BJY59DRAFT_141906 [Rhodotorula toruloides]